MRMTIGDEGEALGLRGRFANREEAGRLLARELEQYQGEEPLVLGLPRGGVVVAHEIARRLSAPLDVWIARKLGAPGHRELGMGALGEGGSVYVDPLIVRVVGASAAQLAEVVTEERQEIARRVRRFRGQRPPPRVHGRTVILVDDGIATGGTVRAAIADVKAGGPRQVVLAVPVASAETLEALLPEVDELVCLMSPEYLGAIGLWYDDFRQVDDEQVLALLHEAQQAAGPPVAQQAGGRQGRATAREVSVELKDGLSLPGDLVIPDGATGLVVFAHGSGSSRHSPRNGFVARILQASGLATLLFDLLTPEEEQVDRRTAELRFDIELLARRTAATLDWLERFDPTATLPVGLFGASTGAAAALVAAAKRPDRVSAVVSRGGRPDLAGPELAAVQAPTLLVVGGADRAVLDLNRTALRQLKGQGELAVVPGAGHLFEEPGALQRVAELATTWFRRHLRRAVQQPADAGMRPPG
jgi:putative phosphoribosyl transferase